MLNVLDNKPCEEWSKELSVFSLEKKKAEMWCDNDFLIFEGLSHGRWSKFVFFICKSNGFRLEERRFHLKARKNFLIVRVTQQWS